MELHTLKQQAKLYLVILKSLLKVNATRAPISHLVQFTFHARGVDRIIYENESTKLNAANHALARGRSLPLDS